MSGTTFPPQTILLHGTTKNQAPTLLGQREPSVELGPTTRVWLGDGTANRLLISSDRGEPTESGQIVVSDTRPAAPLPGDFWLDRNTGKLLLWFVNASSAQAQWVEVRRTPGGGGDEFVDVPDDGNTYIRAFDRWVMADPIVANNNSPLNPAVGQMWFDGDFHVWTGTQWAGLGAANIVDLNNFTSTLTEVGALWYDNRYRLYARRAATWQVVGPLRIRFVTSANSPLGAPSGTLWWDGNQLHVWSGVRWTVLRGGVATTLPVTPDIGQAWGEDGALNVWDGTAWIAVTGDPPHPVGVNWTFRQAVFPSTPNNTLMFGNGRFVAVGTTYTAYSDDGVSWTVTARAGAATTAADYLGGRFIVPTGGATGSLNPILTSLDGITWTESTPATNGLWADVAYGNGVYVVCGSVINAATAPNVMVSPDGVTWTGHTPSTSNANWVNIAYGNNTFIIANNLGVNMLSPDGVTWTAGPTLSPVPSSTHLTFVNGLFIYISTGSVYTSTDAISWTLRSTIPGISANCRVSFIDGQFVAAPAAGSGAAATSPDAITWTVGDGPPASFTSRIISNGTRWVATAVASVLTSA